MPAEQDYLAFLIPMIEQAGVHAMRYFRQPEDGLAISDKNAGRGAFDPVTEADRQVEAFIRAQITAAWPQHHIIGEEFGGGQMDAQTGGGQTWLIDPIDGTRGFLAGSCMWGTLVGLMDGERCLVGAMRQPFTDETWAGDTSTSYYIHAGKKIRIHTRQRERLSECIICCTHPAMYPQANSLAAFNRVLGQCRFSRYGTDCLGYGLLAGGYVDLVVEGGLSAYDIMPLIPVIEGAGGVVSDWQGNSAAAGGLVVAAANHRLHEQALTLLNA